jgi:hypothetical protein
VVDERAVIRTVRRMDAVAEGETHSHGLVERFVFRNGVGDGACQFENTFPWRSARLGHQDCKFVFVDSCQNVEIAQMCVHGLGQARNDPAQMRRAGFCDEFVSIFKSAYTECEGVLASGCSGDFLFQAFLEIGLIGQPGLFVKIPMLLVLSM